MLNAQAPDVVHWALSIVPIARIGPRVRRGLRILLREAALTCKTASRTNALVVVHRIGTIEDDLPPYFASTKCARVHVHVRGLGAQGLNELGKFSSRHTLRRVRRREHI